MADGIPVCGTVRRLGSAPLLVLSDRLNGQDTFLHAELVLQPGGTVVRIRIHTFDDVTVLRPARAEVVAGSHGADWRGVLRLPAARRPCSVPGDLAEALRAAGLAAGLETLDEPERRHMLGFLADAADPAVRRRRIRAIVSGLRSLSA